MRPVPEGVEDVVMLKIPAGSKPADETCFVCGDALPAIDSGQMCWGVPGRGVAHDACYESEGDAA